MRYSREVHFADSSRLSASDTPSYAFPFHVIQFRTDDMSLIIVRFLAFGAMSYIGSNSVPGITS